MAELNPQAVEANEIIRKSSPAVYDLLSRRGKAIYYPSKGILAQGAAAKGKEINATIGTAYEDDGSPMVLPGLADLLDLPKPEVFPYAPSQGVNALRTKWRELMREKNPSLEDTPISLPVASCGVTNGLSIIGYMFIDEGDEIILSDLYWENYDLVFANAYGAGLKCFNFFRNGVFDTESLRQAVNAGPAGRKMVVLNFPNNPSGYSPTLQASDEIVKTLTEAAEAGNRLVVVLDDSYFGLIFEDGISEESLFARLASAHENLLAVKADGITKEEYAWGLRVGFITYGIKNGTPELYAALEGKTSGAVRGNISNASHPSQSLFLHALESGSHEQEKARNKQLIKERYLKVKEVLRAHPEYENYFEALPFNSGYFMCIRIKDLDAEKVWQTLLDKYSTGVICYGEKRLFRIAFASTPEAKIEKLFDNVYNACKDCENP
ncbi:MAG: aminotransferase class I/II-fold pyridoxal phosphate-dependent enzyme [Dehalococcoidales bacterium]|nr:aminotransferase class I/II-fold pyridoxal phosphate-dependent enzyme [Dehalococcoidales bacterium]